MADEMIDHFIRWSSVPFDYGTSDCCQFVGSCIEQETGRNPAKDFWYENKADAEELIARYGDLPALVTAICGEPHEEGSDGDVAFVDDQGILGYVYKDRIVVRTERGLTDLPMSRATRFWRG